MSKKYANLGERIIANSVLSEESFYNGTPCWNWIGAIKINRSGMKYGSMNLRYKSGPRKGKVRSAKAHRMSVEAFHENKRITPKTVVMHLCNNSLCVNPAHLLGGTQKRNVRQCVKDGRHKTPFRDPEKRVTL